LYSELEQVSVNNTAKMLSSVCGQLRYCTLWGYLQCTIQVAVSQPTQATIELNW